MCGRPFRYNGRSVVEKIAHIHRKVCSEKEHRYHYSKQHTSYRTIDKEEYIVCGRAVDIPFLIAIFIAYGLKDEAEENKHPQPVGSPETCGIKQRERCEHCSPECNECSEGQLPFSAHGVDNKLSGSRVRASEQHGLPSLYEKEKHQQTAQHGGQKPPIVLKKFECHDL